MTLQELLSTILDGSYEFYIEGNLYDTSDDIPAEYLSKVVRKVRPHNGTYEGIYRIYLA